MDFARDACPLAQRGGFDLRIPRPYQFGKQRFSTLALFADSSKRRGRNVAESQPESGEAEAHRRAPGAAEAVGSDEGQPQSCRDDDACSRR